MMWKCNSCGKFINPSFMICPNCLKEEEGINPKTIYTTKNKFNALSSFLLSNAEHIDEIASMLNNNECDKSDL